jgi:cobalt-zinc-cadmium efflux system protein
VHSHAEHGPGTASRLDLRRGDNRRRMWIALALNLAMLAAEVVGGLLTGSLALLADAGHALSDAGSIGLALGAAALAARPGGHRRTFGYQRSEVLAAFANGLILIAIAVLIAVAAIGRLGDPPGVEGAGVIVFGALGLAGNLLATVVLAGGERSDLNLEGVLRHSFADALGSLGVIVAGVVILAGGPAAADPVVALLIAGLVLASSWRLIKEPVDVLMEAAPADLDVESLGDALCAVEGVRSVHDLHVWAVTSGFDALSAHVVVARGADRDLASRRLTVLLQERYGIEHTTLQMEEEAGDELLELKRPR